MTDIIIIALLLITCYTDIKKREIPDTVSLCIVVLSLFSLQIYPLGIFAALPFLVSACISPSSIGGGDIKLTAALGLYLGFEKTVFGLIVGQTIFILFYYLSGTKTKSLPLAPFLSVGFIISMMGGI